MDARHYNGEPDAQHDPGRSHGKQDRPFRCVSCARSMDAVTAVLHRRATGHTITDRHGVAQRYAFDAKGG